MEHRVRQIYRRLQDDESRFVFEKRLMHSLTGDARYIQELVAPLPEAKALRQTILQGEENFIFGAGDYGQAVYAMVPQAWEGIFDNNPQKWGQKIGGGTIVPPKMIQEHPHARVFLAVHKGGRNYQHEIAKQLAELGVASERIIRVDQIVDRMAARQYFTLSAMPHEKDETFVDAGAYDGDTARAFAAWAKEWRHIYAFEPDPSNREKCGRTLQNLSPEKTTLFPYGAWKEKGALRFKNTGDWSSEVNEAGEFRIPVSSIDEEICDGRVTFIKMDIEGSERAALEGAEKTVQRNRPKLAICVYHKPEDILDLPEYILSLHPDYRLYLRHYSLISTETVLYCL